MIGGAPRELALLRLCVAALAEKLEVCRRPHPAGFDDLRCQSDAWPCLEMTSAPPEVDLRDGDGVMAPLLLRPSEVADLLKLSERQIARAVADGRLRAVHEGRTTRFRPVDVEAYVSSLAAGNGTTSTKET